MPASAWHRRVLQLAWPIVLANLTQPLLSVVDTAVAGHLPDTAALGGVTTGSLLFNFLFWGCGFLRMGTTALVAQAHGARDPTAVCHHLLRSLFLATALGLLLMALHRPLFALALQALGGSPAVQQQATLYADARIVSAPLALCNYAILGALLGRQQVRLGLVLQLGIQLSNLLAILGVSQIGQLEVASLGYATALADGIGLLVGLALLWRLRWLDLPQQHRWHTLQLLLDTAALRRLLAINRDIFLRTLCLLGSFAWFTRAGALQGDTILAANAILLNFQTFMAYGLDGFAHAAESLVGAAVGARDRHALRAAIRTTLFWSVIGATGFALIYGLAGAGLLHLLTDQTDVLVAAKHYLPWAIIAPLVSVWGFCFDGMFIGATRTRELLGSMLCCATIFCLATSGLTPLWGNHGLWLAMMLFMGLRGLTLAWLLPRLYRWGEPLPQLTP